MPNNTQTDLPDWLQSLFKLVNNKPLVIFRFNSNEWQRLEEPFYDKKQFTIARPRFLMDGITAPRACLLFGKDIFGKPVARFALVKTRRPGTTLDTIVKIEGPNEIFPSTQKELLGLLSNKSFYKILRSRLSRTESVVSLSPKLSVHIIEQLADQKINHTAMRSVVEKIEEPKIYNSHRSIQQDAIMTALRAFGIGPDDPASILEATDRDTALSRVNIKEDAVIEHDARFIHGFKLETSDLTGRAVFRSGDDYLEIITANKRPLEVVMGVDLIYLNAIKQNVVMVQYKMLEPPKRNTGTDWIYRPDRQFQKELTRMKRFSKAKPPGHLEYRINPQVFYLKFVRRHASLGKAPIIMPVDHFEVLKNDPRCKGPKDGFKISYDSLDGRYLRQDAFIDLIRSGYIGAHAETAAELTSLVYATLNNDRAVVAAVQGQFEREGLDA